MNQMLFPYLQQTEFHQDSPIRTEISDENGKFIILYIEIQGTPCILINCYGPNSKSAEGKVLEQIASHLYEMEIDDSVHLVLGGDWNLIFDKTLDFMGESSSLRHSSL